MYILATRMFFLYNISVYIARFVLKIIAVFNQKVSLFYNGRKTVFNDLKATFSTSDVVVWFHCASLGEFEQGRPVIEGFKSQYPHCKILITFFSPSGYEVRKDYQVADLVTYLPMDTKKDVNKFIDLVNPSVAIFVKYEFWPNLVNALALQHIPTILISGIFRKEQAFFKWYGSFMKKSLSSFDHFFVQDEGSKKLLNTLNFYDVTVSGDTRFDRVDQITKQSNFIEKIEVFKNHKYTIVAGSTWLKDEELLINYINNSSNNDDKFIIAPHNINQNDITALKNRITKKTLLLSTNSEVNSEHAQVLIIDSIGILTKIYSYANIAYVGGGFGAGIHNILEPATFGIPILVGPNYHKFNEAKELVDLGACISIENGSQLTDELQELSINKKLRLHKGDLAKNYIKANIGATEKIISYLSKTINFN